MRAVRGGEDVAVLHRLADADRDRLLADRDVEEAGQLAGAEALLDLLLDVPDQEHLAEEVAQPLLRERPPLALDLCHGPESMLRGVTRVTLGRQWRRIQAQLPEDWAHARLAPDADDVEAARPRGRAARPADARTRRRDAQASRSTRGGHGNSPAAVGRRSRPPRRRADPRHARARRRARRRPGRPPRPPAVEDAPLADGLGRARRRAAGGLERRLRAGRARPPATISIRPRSRSRRSTPPATAERPASASAARGRSATAPRPGWCAAASSGSTSASIDGDGAHPARPLRHEAGRHAGPGLVRRRQGRLSSARIFPGRVRCRRGEQGRRHRRAAREVVERARSVAKLQVELALLEIKQKLARIGIGVGLAAGAALVALYAVGFLFAAAAAGLATSIPWWAALLIVGVVLLHGHASCCSRSRYGRSSATCAAGAPRQAIEEARLTTETVTHALAERTQVRQELAAEREQLGRAVDDLRAEVDSLKRKLPCDRGAARSRSAIVARRRERRLLR